MNKLLGRIFGEADIDIHLDEVPNRKQCFLKDPLSAEKIYLPTFYDKETISGKVIINLNKNKSLDHSGIRIDLIGSIETMTDKKQITNFITLTKDLDIEGVIHNELTNYPFSFTNVEKQYESYRGSYANVKYYLKVTITRKYNQVTKEREILVINPLPIEEIPKGSEKICSEVGIEEWLHLTLDFEKNRYHLRDTVNGIVTFKKVSIRLVSMELQIVKKETVGTGMSLYNKGLSANNETTVITKFEIMDGGPFKNETIPIRFFLAPYALTPTYSNINKRFSVQYFISLVLTDAEERKYFKQHEITLIRVDKIDEKN